MLLNKCANQSADRRRVGSSVFCKVAEAVKSSSCLWNRSWKFWFHFSFLRSSVVPSPLPSRVISAKKGNDSVFNRNVSGFCIFLFLLKKWDLSQSRGFCLRPATNETQASRPLEAGAWTQSRLRGRRVHSTCDWISRNRLYLKRRWMCADFILL